MMATRWITSAIVFLIALFVGGFVFTQIQGALGEYGQGTLGFIVSGVILFIVYVFLIKYVKSAQPPV